MFLYDIFTRLLAKICLNASFIGLSRFIAFCVTSTIYGVERNVVANCHAYI